MLHTELEKYIIMFKFLIFFLLVSLSDEHLCISSNQYFNFSTSSFDFIEFEDTILSLKPSNISQSECYIKITYSFAKQYMKIMFNPDSPDIYPEKVNETIYQTTFILDSEPFSIDNILIYNCSNKDTCERDFLLNRLPFLFEQNYTQLKNQLIEIFFQNTEELNKQIEDLSKHEALYPKYCGLIIKFRSAFATVRYDVCNDESKKSTSIIITVTPDQFKFKSLKFNIEFVCLFYGCNDEETMQNMANIILHFYNVSTSDIIYGTNMTRTFIRTTKTTTMSTSNAIDLSITQNLISIYIFLFILNKEIFA